jgi:hypothetical protein
MGILTIRPAERTGARGVFGFAGQSGTGKTLTALYFAWGLAKGNSSKVGFLDTENRRGSLYADKLIDKKGKIHKFLIGDLAPPHSPARYIQALQEFQSAGIEVIVIDSITHEYEGIGGVTEIADNAGKMGWKKGKAEHKKFMNVLLQCNMHAICCVRAREQMNFKNPSKPISMGVQPITEKNVMFEMTASIMMGDEGRSQYTLKCPDDLRPFLGRGNDYITAKDGLAVRKWIDGAGNCDAEVEAARNNLLMKTEQGIDAIKQHWDDTPEKIRFTLGNEFMNQIFASASSFSEMSQLEVPPDSETFEYPKGD